MGRSWCHTGPGTDPSANLWFHFPLRKPQGLLPLGGKEGLPLSPQSEGQGRCRGPCWIPRVPCPHHHHRFLWFRVLLSQRLSRAGCSQEACASSEVGTCLFSSFFSFTMTPVAHRYKSNEEYVYVRGRGRGKYVCEECGIRCKKPSMLKKHIRTHTDVRPYVCKHCHFAFKTKGKRQSAGALPLPAAGSSHLEAPAQSLGHPRFLGSPVAEQLAPDRAVAPLAAPACALGSHTAPVPGTPHHLVALLHSSWF